MVLVIIGVIVNFAVLSVGTDRDDQAEQEVRRLAELIRLAGEEAVFGSREIVLELAERGYRFLELDVTNDKLVAINDDELFRERALPDGLLLKVDIEGDPITLGETSAAGDGETAPAARLYLLSSGEIAPPFELRLEVSATGSAWRLTGDPAGRLEIIAPDRT